MCVTFPLLRKFITLVNISVPLASLENFSQYVVRGVISEIELLQVRLRHTWQVLERVKDPVICGFCVNALNAAYAFKIRCHQTEAKIYECITRLHTPCIDLQIFIPEKTAPKENNIEQSPIIERNTPTTSIKCNVCDKCFVSSELLKEHTMSHFSPVFKCSMCDFQTQLDTQLNEHMRVHTNAIPKSVQQFYQNLPIPEVYQCVDCVFNTRDINLFREHRTIHNTERLYRCSICSFSSTHQSSIKRHTKVHEKPFKCSECRYQTLDKADLMAHMNLHSGQQFKCNYCPYFSMKRSNLRRHRLRNHPDKILPNSNDDEPADFLGEQPETSDPYKVTITDIESILLDEDELPNVAASVENPAANAMEEDSFAVTVDDIQQILQNGNHQEQDTPTGNVEPNNAQNTVFKCPTCSETFKYKYLLRKHVSIHSTDKPFECPECGLRTKTKVHLQGHMKTHGTGVVYTCDKCEYTSMYWGIMQKHNMLHTGEKPFKCPLCTYRGTYQSTVKYHMSSTHTKPYCCTECPYVTNSESELFNHMEVHSSQNRIHDSSQDSIHDSEILYNYIAQAN